MIDKIMKLLGKENIRNIKIQDGFKKNPPRFKKMLEKMNYYNEYQNFEQPIVVNGDNVLIDGYTTYLIAKQLGIRYMKVKRVSL